MSISLQVKREIKNTTVQLVQEHILWGIRGYTLCRSIDYGKTWESVCRIPAKFAKTAASHSTLLSRLLRTGIQNVVALSSGGLLVIADGRFYRLDLKKRVLREVHRLRFGRRPLRNACCTDSQGNVYYGEYWINPECKEVRVYTSPNDGQSWEPIYSFNQGSINHIHVLQYDPFSGWLWVATGDLDPECMIGYSKDGGHSFHFIGSGSEMWRTMALMFTRDYVYWGTDGEREQNCICRWRRPKGPAEKLKQVDGPVYYSMMLKDGSFLVGTGVECAPTEWDDFARLWVSNNGTSWTELAKWQKDGLSAHFFGHGTIYFANGQDDQGCFYFTTTALRGVHGSTMRASVETS